MPRMRDRRAEAEATPARSDRIERVFDGWQVRNDRDRRAAALRARIQAVFAGARAESQRLAARLRRMPRKLREQEGSGIEREIADLRAIAAQPIDAVVADLLEMDNGGRGPSPRPGYVVGLDARRAHG